MFRRIFSLFYLINLLTLTKTISSSANVFTSQLSPSAQSALQTVFACYRVNPSYTGPTFKFRRSSDSNQTNFFADNQGNFGTSVNAMGQSLTSWLGSSAIPYVSIWYDQSGNGRFAYQTIASNQPKFNQSLSLVDFRSTGSVYLVMNTASFSLANNPYTVTAKHGIMGSCSSSWCSIFQLGSNSQSQCLGLLMTSGRQYYDSWYANDVTFGTSVVSGNVVSMSYNQTRRSYFINGLPVSNVAGSGHNTQAANAYLGYSGAGGVTYMNGQLYYLFSFNSALSSADRLIVEGFMPTAHPTKKPSTSPSAIPISKVPSLKPSQLPTNAPSFKPSIVPTVVPSRNPSQTPSVRPTFWPTTTPSNYPSTIPTTVVPTFSPSQYPSIRPTNTPTMLPSVGPTSVPTKTPSSNPSVIPTTTGPSVAPSQYPSVRPTNAPTLLPTIIPTTLPTTLPTASPSRSPSIEPSSSPTILPTKRPSVSPSISPTLIPSSSPTILPSVKPSSFPSVMPTTSIPTGTPSQLPTARPTSAPTTLPSASPTAPPTLIPSGIPTAVPSTVMPSGSPSRLPSVEPTSSPTAMPSYNPSQSPSRSPTVSPSVVPTTAAPSGSPSFSPSMEPTNFPTSSPSSNPTNSPTKNPSFSPSAVPTTRTPSQSPSQCPSGEPTYTPTSSPSIIPTIVPTGSPTISPSAVPSTVIPSGSPSRTPTAEPTNAPTTMPSFSPTFTPSISPSSVPTAMPSTLPSQSPSLEPTYNPSSIPSVEPTNSPSACPSFQPTISPTGSPTNSPTEIPSGNPSETPSADPTKSPTESPSFSPTSAPSVPPSSVPTTIPTTSVPTNDPSQSPSSEPTNEPSCMPTAIPSGLPTTDPSYSPSGTPSSSGPTFLPTLSPSSLPSQIPSIGPTNTPTVNPSTRKTIEPSVTPSYSPSSHPSNVLQLQPYFISNPPTSFPTLTQSSLWSNELQQLLSVASANVGSSVSHVSRYFELDNIDNVLNKHKSSCSLWSSLINNDLASSSFIYNPYSIRMIVQTDYSIDAARDYSKMTVSCHDSTNITSLIKYMTTSQFGTTSPFRIECSGYLWVANYCSGKGNAMNSFPALCIDCIDPCSADARCMDGAINNEYIFAPCVTNSCTHVLLPIIRIFSAEFTEIQPAPTIVKVSTSVSRFSVIVKATLSSQGIVYCGVYSQSSPGPQTIVEIVMMNFIGKTNRQNVTFVEINGLSAVTMYSLYCVTESLLGTRSSIDKLRDNQINITTACCNTITVQTMSSFVLTGQVNVNFLTLTLSAKPATNLVVSISAIPKLNRDRSTVLSFIPSSFSINSLSIVGLSGQLKAQLVALPPGLYSVDVALSGDSQKEYEIVYINNASTFSVLTKNSPLPAPKIVNVIFSDSGSSFLINFDSPTDKAMMKSNFFKCSFLFDFACAISSTCQWIDSNAVNVNLFSKVMSNCSLPGSYFNLTSNAVIKAKCPADNNICPSQAAWSKVTLSSPMKITAPLSPVIPLVTISGPSIIGNCDSLLIDVSTSSGNGGRDWMNKSITVQGEGNSNITQIYNYLKQTVFRVSPPMVIPAKVFTNGKSYYFVVTLCNFFNMCGLGKLRVTVLSNPLPTVSIPGPSQRYISRNIPLTIKSYGSIQNCDGTTSSNGLDFTWTIYQNNVPVLNIISQSLNPSVLIIPAYTLSVGRLYDIQLTVTISSSLQSSKSIVQVYVQSGSLVPRIKGGSIFNIRFGDSLMLDGSQSFDENTNSAAYLIFRWTCIEASPDYLQNCSRLFQNSNSWDHDFLSLKSVAIPYLLDGNVTYVAKITMSIYDSDYARSAQLNVVINLLTISTPLIINLVSNMPDGKMNGADRLKLSGTMNLPIGVSVKGQWSVDDSSFNLKSSTQSPIEFLFHSTSTTLSVYMLIAENAVPVGASLTFTLTCIIPMSQATASVTIVVNSPPQPGKFYVTPLSGYELSQEFTFISENWYDVNLPLTYQYGYVSLTNLNIVLRSISEMTYASLFLPAGDAVQCISQIYDSVNANSSASYTVHVHKSQMNSTQLHQYLTDGFASVSSYNIDTIKQINALASASMNSANCSDSPICKMLNRYDCYKTSHTCGSCLMGFIGTEGDSNDKCFLPNQFCVEGNCTTSSSFGSKECYGNCSNNGFCKYINVNSGFLLSHCLLTDPNCRAVCECHHNFLGSENCDMTTEDLLVKQSSRSLILRGILQLSQIEDMNYNSVTDKIYSISELLRYPKEVSLSEVDVILDILSELLIKANSVSLPIVTINSILDSVDSIASTISSNFTQIINGTKLHNILHQYTTLMIKEMVAGQSSIENINTKFRLKISSISNTLSNASSNTISLTLPSSSLEIQSNQLSPQITMSLSASGLLTPISASLVSFVSQLYANTNRMNSNPLTLRISQLPCHNSSNCEFMVILQSILGITENQNYNKEMLIDSCVKGVNSFKNLTCFGGHSINVTCDGNRIGLVKNYCPVTKYFPTCSSVIGDTSDSTNRCRLVSYTNTNVTCACKAAIPSHRHLSSVGFNSSDNQPTEYQFDFVSLLESTESTFVATFDSVVELNTESIVKGWKVLVTIGTFAVAVIIAMILAYFADQRSIRQQLNIQPAEEVIVKSKKDSIKTKVMRSTKVLTQFTSLKRVKADNNNKSIDDKEKVDENYSVNNIEEYLPEILKTQSIQKKVANEMMHHHRWFAVVFHFSEHFSRLFRVISIVTNIIIMLFLQSLTYNFTNPNDGSCQAMTNKVDCLTPISPYASGEPKCRWDVNLTVPNHGSCSFIEPDSSIKIILFVAILSAIISTPVAVLCDFIIKYILCAPLPSTGEDNRSKKVVKRNSVFDLFQSKSKTNLDSDLSSLAEMKSLLSDLQVYREDLTVSEKTEFDMIWGLNKEGVFISSPKQNLMSKISILFGLKEASVNVFNIVLNDLSKVRASVDIQLENCEYLNDKEKGRLLMRLFQSDLLPGINGKILEMKGNRDTQKPFEASNRLKFVGWAFIISLDVAMLFYIFLFALNQNSNRQEAWFRTFILWLILDIVFVSTAAVLVTHLLIPSLIMKDISKIKERLLQNVSSFNQRIKQRIKNSGDKAEQLNVVSELLEERRNEFNATSYLFVSSRVAVRFLHLREAQLIADFITPWPKQSYQHIHDVSNKYTAGWKTGITRAISTIVFFFINGLLSTPISMQDALVQIGSTGFLGYIIILHVQLFNIFPLLAFVPFLILCLTVYLFFKIGKSMKRERPAKLTPLIDDDVTSTNAENTTHTDMNAKHVNRRQSLLQGISVVQKLQEYQQDISCSSEYSIVISRDNADSVLSSKSDLSFNAQGSDTDDTDRRKRNSDTIGSSSSIRTNNDSPEDVSSYESSCTNNSHSDNNTNISKHSFQSINMSSSDESEKDSEIENKDTSTENSMNSKSSEIENNSVNTDK